MSGHTHYYAGSSSAGGAASSVANSLTIKVDNSTLEGTGKYTFDGSSSKSINLTGGSNVSFLCTNGTIKINTTDTKYSAGTGLSLSASNVFSLSTSGVTAGSAGPTSDSTTSISVPRITVDSYGRVTGLSSKTYTSSDTHHVAYLRAGSASSTSNSETSNGYTYLNLVENSTLRSGVKLNGNTDIDISSTSGGVVNIKTTAIRSSTTKTVSATKYDSSHGGYVSAWTSTTDSYVRTAYPYQCFVEVSGVTASQYPDVVFRPSDVDSWELAPLCKTAAGGVYIYAKKQPTSSIYILSMRFF